MKIRPLLFIFFFVITGSHRSVAADDHSYVSPANGHGYFPLVVNGKPAALQVSPLDFPGVTTAANNLQSDLQMVSGSRPLLSTVPVQTGRTVVLIGTIGKNPEIDQLIKDKKLSVSGLSGKWETFIIQVVPHPSPGIDQALVIAGSDKRGTIFGIYDLSSKIGVSPWYWWADVPVIKRQNLYILPGIHTMGEPAVKYRGIFLNDEAPALSGWTKEKFGGFNHQFYAHVFELILRLKGNYLWPAMWGNAFYDDDPLNAALADEYGVVIGTSHHEPLMRAHDEWRRYGHQGAWNYSSNADSLKAFWEKGIARMGNNESIVTVGMRGDGDEPMSEGSNIALLEKIVKDQREIIARVTGKEASATPQLWALYKEVQDYYDKGMRVPDDITLLLSDDNWGNLRKLPQLNEKPRKGGYGIYYHFDYVGDPRNYKWLNTNPLPRVQEQMNLAYAYGAKQIWIVNVGDLKPMEFPIEFFLDYAWSPAKWPANKLQEYTVLWAGKQFGTAHAIQIASVLSRYGKYSSRRKPELLDDKTYSLTDYNEFERVVTEYAVLKKDAELLYSSMPANAKDAFYQLVLHPVLASANLYNLYYAVAKNKLYAAQGRASARTEAAAALAFYKKDQEITAYYNTQLAGGKWNHMMDQTHIGYTSWQQPAVNKMPELKVATLAEKAQMGLALEGSSDVLPALYNKGTESAWIELYNKGKKAFHYKIRPEQPWVKVSTRSGIITSQQRVTVTADFAKAPTGHSSVPVLIEADNGQQASFIVNINNFPELKSRKGFLEENGYISIEAAHFSKAVNANGIAWEILPDHGRTLSAVTAFPVTAGIQQPGDESARLEYQIFVNQTGTFKVNTYLSPTLDFTNGEGLFYAISIDDEKPQLVSISAENERNWSTDVSENIKIKTTEHHVTTAGSHTLKYWMVSPAVVLQKIVVETKNIPHSYLGPPESVFAK